MAKYQRFQNLTYDDFRRMSSDPSLSQYEKIGFPDSYRLNLEGKIFADITQKLSLLMTTNKVVLEIGPGLSDLPKLLIELCRKQHHTLLLVDSDEVLRHIPNESFLIKIPGRFPSEVKEKLKNYQSGLDVILCYSVFHYIFAEENLFRFLDTSLSLLREEGQFLIGDIPNVSKRKRFFKTARGISYHQNFTNQRSFPEIEFNCIEEEQIEDAVIFSLLSRARSFGFDAYVLPQAQELPMANRREDILITH